MKVLYLPLDSRPCNYVFPVQMARWAGVECVVPSLDIMDYFTKPSEWACIRDFIETEFETADAFAVSIDNLCYGSLLASREKTVSLNDALTRLEFLQKLHEKHPEKPIHAFNVIVRSTISTLSIADRDVYYAVTAYAESSDRYSIMKTDADLKRMEEAKAKIPPEVLEQVNAVRRRNHRVNLRCLEWRKAGVLSSLALLMEDSQPYGFHRKEQRILLQRMDGTEDTFMHNGADEGGCVSMAKALSTGMLPVCVKWIGRRDGKFVAKFEDRPFAQNVRDNMYYLNMKEDPEAEIVLAIAAPSDGQQGDFHEADYPLEPELLSQMAGEINSLIDAGKRVYLLDVLCANGGSPLLLASVDAVRLAGYSAWNTATNAMGTILGQIRTDALAGKTNIQFRNERYMDDMLYESIIRLALDKELLEKGEDSYHLADKLAVEKMVNKHYQMLGKEPAYARIFEGIRSVGEGYMTFPWPRTFEIQAHNV